MRRPTCRWPEPCIRFTVERRTPIDEAVRGGDLFDVVHRANGSAVVFMADVSSKGALGLRHTRTLRRAFHACVERETTPSAMLSALNRIRLDGPPPLPNETFASAIVVVIESGAVDCRYASAGHHIGLVAQGTAHRHLMPTGPVLGIIDDATFSDVSEPFSDRDLLLLATDGFTECRSASQPWHQFGTAGIARAIAGTTPHQWATAARLVAANADAFTGGHYRDDATLAVLARATPPGFA